jgi:hypothetical protein
VPHHVPLWRHAAPLEERERITISEHAERHLGDERALPGLKQIRNPMTGGLDAADDSGANIGDRR